MQPICRIRIRRVVFRSDSQWNKDTVAASAAAAAAAAAVAAAAAAATAAGVTRTSSLAGKHSES